MQFPLLVHGSLSCPHWPSKTPNKPVV